MGWFPDIAGTLASTFKVGRNKAILDASGLTASRTLTLPNRTGKLATIEPFTATSSSLANGASITVTHDADTGYYRQCSARAVTGPGADGCVLLLNADGSDGSTTFTDSSYYAHSVTANGNAQLDTAQSKFGGSSILCDGSGDYLSFSGSLSEFALGTVWTFATWLRLASTSGYPTLFDFRPASTSGNYPSIYLNAGAVTYYLNAADRIVGATLSTNTWYHIALVSDGSATKLYIDGAQSGSTYSSAPSALQGSDRPVIGDAGHTIGSGPMNGWFDSLIIQKGVARYTGNFTPPTSAYAADAFAVGLVQCVQSGVTGMVTEYLSSTTTRFTNNTGATLTGVVAQVYNCQGA